MKSRRFYQQSGGFCGASDLTRTGDLLITSEMHYRLCYTSASIPDIIAERSAIVNSYFVPSGAFFGTLQVGAAACRAIDQDGDQEQKGREI